MKLKIQQKNHFEYIGGRDWRNKYVSHILSMLLLFLRKINWINRQHSCNLMHNFVANCGRRTHSFIGIKICTVQLNIIRSENGINIQSNILIERLLRHSSRNKTVHLIDSRTSIIFRFPSLTLLSDLKEQILITQSFFQRFFYLLDY